MQTPNILLRALKQDEKIGRYFDHEAGCEIVNTLIAEVGRLNTQVGRTQNPVIEMICSVVAVRFGVSVPWMMSTKRSKMRTRCRALAIAICAEKTEFSLTEIAEQFCLDYSTATYNIRKGRLDPEFLSFLE